MHTISLGLEASTIKNKIEDNLGQTTEYAQSDLNQGRAKTNLYTAAKPILRGIDTDPHRG